MADGFAAEFQLEHFQNLAPGKSAPVDGPVGSLEFCDVFDGVAAAAETDDVQPDHAACLTVKQHVGRHVLDHSGVSSDHRELADSAELVHGYGTRDECPILDLDMPAEQSGVGEDAVVANGGVVAEVGGGHYVVVIADDRDGVGLHGSVYGSVLAKHIVVTDHHPADFSRPSYVLRSTTDDGMFAKLIVAAGGHSRLDDSPTGYGAEIAQFCASLDRRERSDSDPNPEPGFGIHHSQWMDAHGNPFGMIRRVAAISTGSLSA
jgi:hypothetical protein